MKANEFNDTADTLRAKVKVLKTLITNSKEMIAYTGAGISTSAGISDYATKNKDLIKKTTNWADALPTYSH